MVKVPFKISVNPRNPKQSVTVRSGRDILKWSTELLPDPFFLTAARRLVAGVASGEGDCTTGDPDNDRADASVDWSKGGKAILIRGNRATIRYNVKPCSVHAIRRVEMQLEAGPRTSWRLVALKSIGD